MPDTSLTSASLAPQTHWDDVWSNIPPTSTPPDDQLTHWLRGFVKKCQDKTFFEVGCYPGGYTSFFGSMGYQLSGIDLTPRTADLQKELSKNYSVGEIINADWNTYESQKSYDVVASFGFIEHFTDWKSAIIKQSELVSKDGLFIIETPNLGYSFLRTCYHLTDPVTLGIHVKESMNPKAWEQLLLERNFEIIWSGYFGNFIYWETNTSPTYIQKKIISTISCLSPLLRKVGPHSYLFSPYCGLVAKRK